MEKEKKGTSGRLQKMGPPAQARPFPSGEDLDDEQRVERNEGQGKIRVEQSSGGEWSLILGFLRRVIISVGRTAACVENRKSVKTGHARLHGWEQGKRAARMTPTQTWRHQPLRYGSRRSIRIL